jgi:hypothetical protein
MAICERRYDRPAALPATSAEDGGLSDLVASRGMLPLDGRGKKIANKLLRVKVSERMRRVIRQQKTAVSLVRPSPWKSKRDRIDGKMYRAPYIAERGGRERSSRAPTCCAT